jgi:glycosyltransferase involved in cell wall biosynthesis
MWPDERRPWYGSFVFSQAQSLREVGVEIDVVYIPGYLGRARYARGWREMRTALESHSYDLVHAHYGHSGVIGRLQTGAPLIISYCGDDLLGTPAAEGPGMTRGSQLTALAFAQLARVARRTITKSEQMARRLPARARERNEVIPNGVDLDRFVPMDRADARVQLGWEATPPNVLFMGGPQIVRKNLALARRVCQELTSRGEPVTLREADDIPPEDVALWMNASDVLLFPSLSEGSPNAIKEAMACELPIVSAPVGDVPERLSGVEGTFVVPRDVNAMADAVIAALSVGRAPAARQAVSDLSLERVAQRICDVYWDAIGESPHTRAGVRGALHV